MKTELSKIAKDLEQGAITETEAQALLLGLLSVSKRFYGVGHDEKLCSNPDCVCHTDINKRVATPFPLDTGNPYCCPECALAKHPLNVC